MKEQLVNRDESDENLLLENFSLKNFRENIGEYDRVKSGLKSIDVGIDQNFTGNIETDKKILINLKKLLK